MYKTTGREGFLVQLQLYLEKHKMREALELMRNEETRERLASDSELMWDTIPIICSRLRTLNEFRFKTFGACQEMLLDLALLCKPKEVLISLLAELENENLEMQQMESKDSAGGDPKGPGDQLQVPDELKKYQAEDSCFKAILKPLETILIKMPNKRNETLKWVLSTLNNHLLRIPVPKDYGLEPGRERLLLSGDVTVRRFSLIIPLYLDFLGAFVSEYETQKQRYDHQLLPDSSHSFTEYSEAKKAAKATPSLSQKEMLLKSLISLLYHPFMFFDLSVNLPENCKPQEKKKMKNSDKCLLNNSRNNNNDKNNNDNNSRSKPVSTSSQEKKGKDQVNGNGNGNCSPSCLQAKPSDFVCSFLRNSNSGGLSAPSFPGLIGPNEPVLCAIKTLELISKLEPNLYKLYDDIQVNSNEWKGSLKEDTDSDLESEQEGIDNALAVAAYLVIGQHLSPKSTFVPSVYSHLFALETHLPLIHTLLEKRENVVHEKGLVLAERLISQISPYSLTTSFYDLLKKHPIDKSLIKVMRFSNIKLNRQRALKVFKAFINSFTNAGRYQLLHCTVAEPGQHAGVKGLALSLYKDFIATEADLSAFVGTNLHRILRKVIPSCLPEKGESDLLENGDTIMGTLNLIRFLCLKDPKTVNKTNIWKVTELIQKELLEPLRKAIDLSRAHYRMELKKIEEESSAMAKSRRAKAADFEMKVLNDETQGADGLFNLPPDHEKQVIVLALVNFDMMESVLVRVNEILI